MPLGQALPNAADDFAEMFWTGTEDCGGYGMMNKHGQPWPVFHAKRLCAQCIRYGDWIWFPADGRANSPLDVVVARGESGPRGALFVHLQEKPATYAARDWIGTDGHYHTLLKIDEGTGNQVVEMPFDGAVPFEGYGVAAVLTESSAALLR